MLSTVVFQGSISDCGDDFQQLVLSVLQEVVVPDRKVIKVLDKPTSTHLNVLDEVLRILSAEINGEMAKHKFCWSIVARFCSKLHPSRDLQWICMCTLKLCYIYAIYYDYNRIQNKQRLLIEDLEAIHRFHSTDMRK